MLKTEGLWVDENFYNVNFTGIGMLLHKLDMSGEIRSNILSLSTLVVQAILPILQCSTGQ